jgi:ATP-binding cassette subfamily B protein
LGERIAKKTRSDIALKYFSLNYLGAKSVDAGLLSSLVGEDIREIQQTFTRLMSSILKDGLMSFIFLIWLVVLDWQLFILFITVLVPASIVLRVTSKTLKILSKQGIQFESELLSGLLERMRGWQTIQVNKAIPFEIKNFNKINDKIYHVWRRVTRAKSLGNPLVEWFGITAAAFIIIAALRRISNGSLDSSIFTSFMVTVAILSDKINRISNQLYSTRKGTEALKRIREFLIADFKRIDKTIRKKNLTQCKFETLEFQNLSIGNLTSKILAKNLNLTLRKGALLVIVGPSGVGKSTFIKTVLGLQPQISGSIFINKEIATESLFQKVSHDICFIPQEPFLFSGTIFENVVYPEKLNHPTPEEIKLAKRALSLSQLDKDLKSEIHGISGGEKQRLMFARIFYKNPGLIVIDEGTSALDLSNELKIIENLKNHVTQSITLVIAHRPAIKKYATHILDLSTKE